jgi:hypothetical protein
MTFYSDFYEKYLLYTNSSCKPLPAGGVLENRFVPDPEPARR